MTLWRGLARWCQTGTVHEDGVVSHIRRMERVFLNVGTEVLLDLRASVVFTESLFDERLPSDHAPLRLTLHSLRGPPRQGGPLPKWIARHSMYLQKVRRRREGLDFKGCDAFERLEGYTDVVCQAAKEVLEASREPLADCRAE